MSFPAAACRPTAILGRRPPRFLLPVRVLSRLFRRLFLQALEKAYAAGKLQFFGELRIAARSRSAFARYLAPLRRTDWVIYAKPPFGGPQHVLEYLGRYTHRVAISNHACWCLKMARSPSLEGLPRTATQSKVMTVPAEEFIRRFLLARSPAGFPTHPLFRLAGQLPSFRQAGFLPSVLSRPATAICCRSPPIPVTSMPH